MMFGISYIPLAYITSFIFKKADAAFKYNVGLMGLYAGFFILLNGIVNLDFTLHLNYWLSPFWCLFNSIQLANKQSDIDSPPSLNFYTAK
jgi:biotin transporter BioY